jgi:hypothetical protein
MIVANVDSVKWSESYITDSVEGRVEGMGGGARRKGNFLEFPI